MSSLQSHLTVLESVASSHPSAAAFKVPRLAEQNGRVHVAEWLPITYQQFLADVHLTAKYWFQVLSQQGIPQGSIIGLWISGMEYQDVLHVYGLSRAGYIPQLFSLRLPNVAVIYELLHKAGAKALIYEPSFESTIRDAPIRTHRAVPISQLATFNSQPLVPLRTPTSENDLVFIFHTSGSTSGSPKLVPCNYRWVDSAVMKSAQFSKPAVVERQDVTVWMGSMCHIAQSFMLIGSLQFASCTIQPTRIDFSSDELANMIINGNLNRLNQFASFLGGHLRFARQNPKMTALLRSLDCVVYSGLPLGKDEEEFAFRNGINTINLFGSTECGAMLLSQGGTGPDARTLAPLDGVNYGFFPITPANQTESGHVSANSQLLELVILSDSPDCPDTSLRRMTDGHFHTGDLFQETSPGRYTPRGRDDDWIKSRNSLRCDTRAIEDNVRACAAELIDECIVVGNGRPSPVLFIEPAVDMDPKKLKKEILRRTRQFHSRRYLHERITSPECIVIVERKALPRTATKGNIRRRAVEEVYKQRLDEIFGVEA